MYKPQFGLNSQTTSPVQPTPKPSDTQERKRYGANVGKTYVGKKIFPPACPVVADVVLVAPVSEASVVIEDQESTTATIQEEPKENWRSKRKKAVEPDVAVEE